jgi:aerobic carbon-monoxide dehydrogenase medium subunit
LLLNLREYHRPALTAGSGAAGLHAALDLLARPTIRTRILAGADSIVGSADPSVEAVVDLQGLALDDLTWDSAARTLHIGALVTRAVLAGSESALALANGVVAEGAADWSGSVQRRRATIGGALAVCASNDPLILALLVCGSSIQVISLAGECTYALADYLAERPSILASPAIITAIQVPEPGVAGAAVCSVRRTPADAPIVSVAALVRVRSGVIAHLSLGLAGLHEGPILVPIAAPETGHLRAEDIRQASERVAACTSNTDDYRGSASYRRDVARILCERALIQAAERAA